MRAFKSLLWFAFGFLLVAAPMLAFAETIAATGTVQSGSRIYVGTEPGPVRSSCPLACDAVSGTWNIYTCVIGGTSNGCSNGSWTVYSCPSSYTLSGTSCTRPDCAADETRDAQGVCRPTNPCVNGETSTATRFVGTFSSGQANVSYGTQTPTPSHLCNGTCQGVPSAATSCTSTSLTAGTPIQCTYSITLNGAQCSGGNGSPGVYTPCMSQGKVAGTVNGVTVCTGSSPVNTTSNTTTSGQTSSTTGGTTTSTSGQGDTKSETTCTGDTCTTTTTKTTTTTNGAGQQTTGQETSTTTQTKGDFCKENPTNKQCTGLQQSDYCEKNPQALSCMTSGDPTEGEALGTKNVGISSLSPVSLNTSMSCPADLHLPRDLGVISYQPACNLADLIRPFVLVMAWLGAGLILFGGVKNG